MHTEAIIAYHYHPPTIQFGDEAGVESHVHSPPLFTFLGANEWDKKKLVAQLGIPISYSIHSLPNCGVTASAVFCR